LDEAEKRGVGSANLWERWQGTLFLVALVSILLTIIFAGAAQTGTGSFE
jgi:hypothetical protein